MTGIARARLLRLACAGLAVLAVALAGCTTPGSVGRLPSLSSPPRLAPFQAALAGAKDEGPVGSAVVSVDLVMRNPRQRRENRFLARLYSARVRSGHFLSASQIAHRFGPSISRVDRVMSAVRHLGLSASHGRGSDVVRVRGTGPAIDRAFHVNVRRYRPPRGASFIASSRDPVVPVALRALVESAGRVSTLPPVTAAIPGGGITPSGIDRAYDITPLIQSGATGAGQTVVFVEIDGYESDALHTYASRYHLPPFHITQHGPTLSGGDEATMDLEVVHAIAPKAKLVVYNFQSNTDWVTATHRVVAASRGDVISESLGLCEQDWGSATAQSLENEYKTAALLGESVFASTGDSAAYGCLNYGETPSSRYVGIQLPAGCPHVTAVGGTRLSVRQNGSWYDESAWEQPIETGGTGGGISSFFPGPSWQKAPGVAAEDGANNQNGMRMVPDVSADADPGSGMAMVWSGGWGQGGGTSQAAPIWAAITALANQYLQAHHHRAVGWMNPALYSIARSAPYSPFHDVTIGTNLFYPAAAGYDVATGLGTPDAWNITRDLLAYQASRGQ